MTKSTDTRLPSRFPAMLPATMLLLAAASCVSDPAGLDPVWLGAVDLTPVTPAGDQWNPCTTWDCGKNHPLLNTFPLHDLHEAGLSNADGFGITSLRRFGVSLALTVEQGVMTGSSATSTYTGAALIGSIINVHNNVTNETWQIEIHDFTSGGLLYWVGGGTRPAYHLRYRALGTRPWKNLCNAPLEPSDEPLWPDAFETYAILIDDERYDRDAKQVLAGDGEGWFNIACAGSTLAKMVLMHYDPNVPAMDPAQTSVDQRTTVIKMLTADYLGTGVAFTQPQTLLQWADAPGWHTVPVATQGTSEAVWDENGAVCLDAPRLATVYPNIDEHIESNCLAPGCTMPPTCDALGITDQNWTQHGLWRTWW
jgi:hypothetical protein